MRICYPFCYPGGGGTEWHALYLAREARKSGDEVFFILNGEGFLTEQVKKEGFASMQLDMSSSFNPIKVLKAILALKKYFKENEIDIVHTHMLREQALAIGAKIFGAKIKLIRTFHRVDQFNWKMKPLMWLFNLETDYFIAISNYMIGYLKENGIKGPVELVYNGVTRIPAEKHEKALGFMGRVVPEKGILNFVKENYKLLENKKFYVGGVGEDLEKLEQFVKDKKLKNIDILGRVHDTTGFFEKISVFVLPASHEVLPLVALEAFSCGIPVVAFDLPVLAEMIDGKNGIRIECGDYKKLAETALEMLNGNKLAEYQKAAKESYENNYTIEQMWHKTEALYKKVVSSE